MDSLTPSNHVHFNSLSQIDVLESNPIDYHFFPCFNEENDCSDATLKFINDMLMEEENDLESTPSLLHDSLALQATERSFFDALHNNHEQNSEETKHDHDHDRREKKNRLREDDDLTEEEQRCSKQLAGDVASGEEAIQLEMYDNVLLLSSDTSNDHSAETGGARKRAITFRKEIVDLRSLLMKCAQAVAILNTATAIHLLLKIRRHSSPLGESLERVAHYFANALEARMDGIGTKSYREINLDRISTVEILKSYKMYTVACPFYKMSIMLANKAIEKLANGATMLHIIDFGILYGFQWPSLIQMLSQRHGGPPKLRITGIELPQKGPRPAQRVEDTGRRLAKYCERFSVPFEYNAVAQKWETIKLEDLTIEKDEVLVVNCLNRLHNLLDEIVVANTDNPRDAVLSLINNINPDMFIHGIANGNYNEPFFTTRFREAFFHYYNRFDMFESTIPRDDQGRLLSEEQVFGKEAMNIIACEGTDRTERPETYKKWQIRMRKVGFRQLPLDQEVVKYVGSMTKAEYHQGFSVYEDGKWMLQGWKGRVIHAIACWQPAHIWSSYLCPQIVRQKMLGTHDSD